MRLIEWVLVTPALPEHCGGWEFRYLCKLRSEHLPDTSHAATWSAAERYGICSISTLTLLLFFGHEWFFLSSNSPSGSMTYTDGKGLLFFIWKFLRNNRWGATWLSLLLENAVILMNIASQFWMLCTGQTPQCGLHSICHNISSGKKF